MKRLALTALLSLGFCAALPAQQLAFLEPAPAPPPATLSSSTLHFSLAPNLAPPPGSVAFAASPTPSSRAAALPDAPPAPQFPSSNDDFYRFDLAIGYEYIHFNAAPFNLNLSGVHTALTYNLRDWFGVEGSVISAFGGDVFSDRARMVLYTGGAHLGWGVSSRRWTPWAHALVGGIHLSPQTAAGSKNGFAFQAGGGADFAFRTRVSLRAEADYLRTQLYSSSQNNFQIGVGAVIHF